MTKIPRDYLKYWKVIRQYYKTKYNITQSDFDMLLFLYSEDYFTRDTFKEFAALVSWEKERFNRLMKEGWIYKFRSHSRNSKALYHMTDKGRNIIKDVYRKLNGEEIPTSLAQNPMFLKNVKYTDKVYRNMIMEMNEFTRQQRHRSPE
jgi:hypothetical protein